MTVEQLTHQVARPSWDSFNSGLTCPKSSWMVATFGKPGALTDDCSDVAPEFARKITSANIGPFTATGHRIAIQSLQHVFDDIRAAHRMDIVSNVHCNGMLCVRKVRGGRGYSNHSFGTAIDLYFGSDPDAEVMGDGMVQQGLIEIYSFFHARKWYAGIGYQKREDAMHFEASVELIEDWISLGLV